LAGGTEVLGENLPSIVPARGDYDAGEIDGMMIGRGDRSTRRKPAPGPICPHLNLISRLLYVALHVSTDIVPHQVFQIVVGTCSCFRFVVLIFDV
jgi:hypothetical protein